MKSVLIIGATGTTGFYLTEYLSALKGKYQLWVSGSKARNTSYLDGMPVRYVQLDISKADDFSALPKDGFDSVVLLAGAMPARMNGYDPHAYVDINVSGTLNVLEYCRRSNVRQIIFTQSHSDVFGSWNKTGTIPPEAPRELNYVGDHAVYIISKCCAVDLIEHYHQQYNISSVILRLPNVYSYWPIPYYFVDGIKRPTPYLTLINRAIKSEPIEIWGDPGKAKDMVYVKDFAQIAERCIDRGIDHATYNVGTGVGTTLEEEIRVIVDVFSPPGTPSPISYRPDLPSQNSYVYDIRNAESELGYKPRYLYSSMLEDMQREMHNARLRALACVDSASASA